MIQTRSRSARIAASLVAALLLAVGTQAAPSQSSSANQGLGFTYDRANEITRVGTVEELVAHSAPGSPPGLHLLISASGKTIDAHVGPFFSKQNREALIAGQPVQVIGVNENVHGKDVLFVRQLTFAGQTVTVRNERGFLVRENLVREHLARSVPYKTKLAAKGGAQ